MPAPTDSPTPFAEKFYRAATHPLRLLPDFLIIGAQRGGTTSLYNYLADHPNIGTASIKEVHFFDSPHFRQGSSWYRGHFPSALQKYYIRRVHKRPFLTGEASPYYLFHPHTPQRVAQLLPTVKLIVMLRNPVDRAYSHYYHEVAGGHEKLATFEEAIDAEEARLAGEREKMFANEHSYSYKHRHFSYVARGIYIEQLQTWFSLFRREQFLLLKSEDFYADPGAVFKRTLAFLNIPDTTLQGQEEPYRKYNTTKPPKMHSDTRKRLNEYFEPHNARLYDLIGASFHWD